jgi:hypothetical protein
VPWGKELGEREIFMATKKLEVVARRLIPLVAEANREVPHCFRRWFSVFPHFGSALLIWLHQIKVVEEVGPACMVAERLARFQENFSIAGGFET